jgi:hypothetical protein
VTIACLYTLLKQGLANQQCLFKTAAQVRRNNDNNNNNNKRPTTITHNHHRHP